MGVGAAVATGAVIGMEAAMISNACHRRRGPEVVVVNRRRF